MFKLICRQICFSRLFISFPKYLSIPKYKNKQISEKITYGSIIPIKSFFSFSSGPLNFFRATFINIPPLFVVIHHSCCDVLKVLFHLLAPI